MSENLYQNKKGILLEHRVDYKALYGLNLYVYLGIEPIVCSTVRGVIDALAKHKDIDLIFVDNNSYSVDVGQELYSYLVEKGIDDKIPYFIVGKTKAPSMHITIFDSNMQLKYILQSVAKAVDVTAKTMAETVFPEYFPLPIEFVLPGWQCASPVFRKTDDGYIQVFDDQDIILCEIIEEYEELGEEALYVESAKRLRFVNSLTLQISAKLNDPNLSPQDRVTTTAKGFQMVMEQARKIGVTQTTMEIANDCMESMNTIVECTADVQSLLDNLLNDQTTYRYQHSLLTLYIGTHIIKNMPWGNKEHMEKLAYMCFFHDIALTHDNQAKFRSDEELMNSDLPEKEKKLIFGHALTAAKLMSNVPGVPFGMDSLLKQHHGSGNGRGLSKINMTISPLAIVFIFAEEWTDIIFKNIESDMQPDKKKIIKQLHVKYNIPAFNKILPVLHTLEI